MTNPVWQRDEPDSPCINICQIHPVAKICIGCFRTIEEISSWPVLDASARQAMAEQLPARADQVKPKRRGGVGRNRLQRQASGKTQSLE